MDQSTKNSLENGGIDGNPASRQPRKPYTQPKLISLGPVHTVVAHGNCGGGDGNSAQGN